VKERKGGRMRRKVISVVMLMVAMSMPLFGRCGAPPIAELLPAESLGYVELSDMGVFYYLVSELGGAAVQSLEEESEVPEEIRVKARAILEAFNEIEPLLPRSASLGVVSVDAEKGQPSLLFVGELSDALGPLAAAASKLLAAAPNVEVRKTDYGVEVVIPHAPVPPIGCAVKDNVLYLAAGEGLLDRALSRTGAASLSQTAHFKEVNAITGKNAFLSAYLNVDAIRESLLPVIPPQAKGWLEVLGLNAVHAAGLSLSADARYVGANVALQYTTDAPGIPGLLSVPNTRPEGIAYIPDDFSYVTRFSLGPPAETLKKVEEMLVKAGMQVNLSQSLEQMKQNTGIDVNQLLASLGGELTVGVKVPETLAIPNVVVCLEAKEPEYVMETLKGLLQLLQMPCTELEMAGRKVMMITPTVPIPVAPAVAVDKDVIIMGLSSGVVQKALAAKDNGTSIASKPAFKAAFEGLPADSNVGLEYIEMENLAQLAITGLSILSARAPEEAKPLIARAMPYAYKAVQNLEEAVEVVYRTPNGLALQSRWGTRSIMQVLRNGAALGAKAAIMFVAHREVPIEEEPESETPPQEPSPMAVEEVGTGASE
jgi:hypothetical protein